MGGGLGGAGGGPGGVGGGTGGVPGGVGGSGGGTFIEICSRYRITLFTCKLQCSFLFSSV